MPPKGCTSESILRPGISARQVELLLNGFVVGTSRRNLKRKQQETIEAPTLYGLPLQSVALPGHEGETVPVHWEGMAHPAALLNHLAQNTSLGNMLSARMEIQRPTLQRPWRLIYFADECTAGNLLRRDPTKKGWCIYISWIEMGPELLSKDIAWLPIGVLNVNTVKKISGGFNTVFRYQMEYFFGRHCDLRDGITIHTREGKVLMLFSTLGFVLADELGTKEIWGLKGASSWRCCALCQNVVNARYFEGKDLGSLVLHTERDLNKIKLHSNESIFAAVDRIAEAPSNKKRAELEKMHGINHNTHGVLQCVELRSVVKPASCITYDFMHCFLTNGAADYEMQLYWKACVSRGLLTLDAMQKWMVRFTWPKHRQKPYPMWADYHAHVGSDGHEYYGGGASHLLSFYPVFRDLIQRVMPQDEMVAETKSLLALFRVLDGWDVCVQSRSPPPQWQERIMRWQHLYEAAWPDASWKPKHHFCIHVSRFFDQFGVVPNTFACERRHRIFKRVADHCSLQLDKFDRSLMLTLIADQANSLREHEELGEDPLQNAKEATIHYSRAIGAPVTRVALTAMHGGVSTSSGDMVWLRSAAGLFVVGELLLHMEMDQTVGVRYMSAIRPYTPLADGIDVWVRGEHIENIASSSILSASIWAESPGGRRVLRPPCLQYFTADRPVPA